MLHVSGWESEGPKEIQVIIPGRSQIKHFLSLLRMRTEDSGKSNRGPVAQIWTVARELSRRCNVACFNLTDRRYKLLPEEKHPVIPSACRNRNMKNERERKDGFKHSKKLTVERIPLTFDQIYVTDTYQDNNRILDGAALLFHQLLKISSNPPKINLESNMLSINKIQRDSQNESPE